MNLFGLFGKKNTAPKAAAVIVAAGRSERMGTDKILAELGYMPVIARTLLTFEKSEFIGEIVVVTKSESIGDIAQICRKYAITKASQVLIGGNSRMESALIGVSNLKKKCSLIAVHDGARPLVTLELIERTVRAAADKQAVVPVIRSTDTLKLIDENGIIVGTVDRDRMVRVQTPQVFDADILKGALTHAADSGSAFTDDASAVEAMGFQVSTVPGEEDNIKLTTPGDFLIAQEILKKRGDYIEDRTWL